MNLSSAATVIIAFATILAAEVGESSPEDIRFFEKHIRPVLVESCHRCHATGAEKIGGKLLLDTVSGLMRGGESGSPVVPGRPGESLLIDALEWKDDLGMPPKHPLPDDVIDHFRQWIARGAVFPGNANDADPIIVERDYRPEDLWSFQPLELPDVPPSDSGWPRQPIDYFVAAEWAKHGLAPTEDADPRTLIRRLYFDLTGLPPTQDEIEEFATHYRSGEKEIVVGSWVDRLLASPHFGERWGRHWLDVARYGESNGNDGLSRNASFPHAWRYRDYVIDSFNRDMPYDRFITEQIAGDLLETVSDRDRDRTLIATGFLAIGAKPAKAMNKDFAMDVVADQIETVTSGVIGLSVACARCHDHKTDPIPTRDYYAMAGFFTSTETLWGISANEILTAPPTQLHVLKTPERVAAPPEALRLMEWTAEQEMRNRPPPKEEFTYPPGTPLAMGVRDREKPADCRINIKGSSEKLGEEVPRGFLSAYPDKTLGELGIDRSGSGRRELAAWLTSQAHPQTPRVMVNRIWMHLFGKAIVATPNDFGVYGSKPSHPELLDYLAWRFSRQHDWSIKAMIREIVLSRTYQLGSRANQQDTAVDPDNRWLTRHNRRRLDAESLRDAMLAVSGNLELAPGEGSPIRHLDLLVNKAPDLHQPSRHRSVYLCFLRNSPPRDLVAFDLPDGIKPVGQRSESMLPTQGLFLLNSEFVVNQSRPLADRFAGDIPGLWRAVLQRSPSPSELASARYLLESIDSEERPEAVLAQALLSVNEFRFVD